MFKLVKDRTAWQTVTFPGLTEDGKPVENEIEVQFLLLSSDDNVVFFKEVGEFTRLTENEGDAPPSMRSAKLLKRIVRDWRGIGEANGDPIKFSEEALARLLNVPATFEGMLRAYGRAVNGAKDERAGN